MVQGFSTNIGKLEILYGSPDFDQKVDSFEAPSRDFNYLSKFSQSYKLEKNRDRCELLTLRGKMKKLMIGILVFVSMSSFANYEITLEIQNSGFFETCSVLLDNERACELDTCLLSRLMVVTNSAQ